LNRLDEAIMEAHRDAIIRYFKDGFAYVEILEMLKIREGFQTSLSSLKRFLRRNNLYKRPLEQSAKTMLLLGRQ